MANKKISDLPLAVAMAGTELFEIDQANVSKRISAVGLFTTVLPGLGVPPSPTTDFTIPARQNSTGAAWGVTISSLMTALHGLPGGGTTGQLLTKLSNADYDTAWVNAGTVFSVGLSMPSIFTVSNSPVTSSGTLTAVLNTQTANTIFAGPGTGVAAVPAFRALVGADLPNPSSSTLGGVQSAAAVSHQWINSISTSGVPALSQPAIADISGWGTNVAAALANSLNGAGGLVGYSGAIGAATGTSLALGGATLGSNAFAVNGTFNFASSGTFAGTTLFRAASGTTTVLIQDGAPSSTTTISQSSSQVLITNNALSIEFDANTNGGNTGQLVLNSNGSVSMSGALSVASLAITSALPVTSGGTGRATLTNHGLLVGAATSGITQLAAAAAGTLLTGQGASSDPGFSSTPTLGVAGTTTGSLAFAGSTSGVVTVQPQAAAGTFNFNLPTSAGTAGQPLLSGGGAGSPQTYGTLGVAAGGTGLTSGTSGGILGYTATGTLASSGLLTTNALLLGGGAGATPTALGSLGTTSTVLHGNPSGAPSFGAVVLTTDVSGTLPVGNGGTGAISFTANGVLLGNGVSAVGVTSVGATGSILAGNTAAAPTFQTLSAVIDAATGATTQGSVLFRGASGWTALSPSSAGRVLTTNGAGLDVSWNAVSGTGTVTSITAGTGLAGGTITTTGTISLNATAAQIGATGVFYKINAVPFTSSGTYTPSTGMVYCIIEAVGGGGGGGGATSSAGNNGDAGGGGAGSYSRAYASAATIGASKAVTIGAAGTAGASTPTNGGGGGATSLGVICTANGGAGGLASSGGGPVGAGAGGAVGTGNLAAVAGPSGFPGLGNAVSSASSTGGIGGSSPFGSGGQGGLGQQAGVVANGYGAGGGGGASYSGSGAVAGGAGTAGYVIVTEFLNQ